MNEEHFDILHPFLDSIMHQQQANAEDDYQTGVEPNEINRLICAQSI